MNFTFVRAERSQEENQERAFIAASRRQDRDFKQRLESLQKASELHFARTGKRFVVAQSQVTHNGPLIEFVDVEKKRREVQRFMPYTLDQSNVGTDDKGRGFLHKDINSPQHRSFWFTPTIIPGPSQEESWDQTAIQCLDQRNYPSNTPSFEASTIPLIDVYNIQNTQDVDTKGAPDIGDELDGSFLDLEYLQRYQDSFVNLEMQGFLDVHFSIPQLTRSDEAEEFEPESTERGSITQQPIHLE